MALTRKVKSGLTQAPFDTYIGEPGQIFFSNDTGEIRISDGVTPNGKPVYVAVTSANIGDLVINGASIQALNTNQDLDLVTNGTGNVNIYGSFLVHTDGLGSTASFGASPNGFLTINTPSIPSGTSGALNIIGSGTGDYQPVNGAGGMLHITGNDNTLARITVDGYATSGTGAQPAQAGYGLIALRASRGTAAAPLYVLKDDILASFSGLGMTGTVTAGVHSYSTGQVAGLQFFAAEDFVTNTGGKGTYAQLKLTPVGGSAGIVSTSFYANGIVTGNITISNTATFNGPSVFNGLITSNGDSTFNGNVTNNGNTIVTGSLTVNHDTQFNGNLNLDGIFTVTGDTIRTGNVTDYGTRIQNGQMFINNQLSVTGTGNIAFSDGTVQSTASIKQINNLDHITGALGFAGNIRTLSLSSDATPVNTPSTIVSRNAQGNVAVGNVTATTLTTTSITANSSIAGSLTVYGNLNVVGTTTTTTAEAIHVDSKTLTVANSATLISQVDGAGLLVGNATIFADFVFDSIQDAWRSNVGFVSAIDGVSNLGSESRNWGNLYVKEGYITNKLNVGITPMVDYLNVAQFTANVPQYSQVYNQNLSSNSGASTDFVAANDIGGEINNYIDIGINSSTYNEPAYSIQYANDGYVFINGGNLTVGTQTLNKDIVFHTDGTTADKEAGRVHLGRWILGGTDDGINKLQVGGNIIAGNVSATNLTNQFATLTANAAAQANQITGANAAIVTANTAMKSYVDAVTTAWTANAATQAAQITGANAAIAAVTTAWTANAATQQGQITTLQSQVYTNANVAAYLPTYTGNVSAGNVNATAVYGDLHGKLYRPVRDAGTIADAGTLTIDFLSDAIVYCAWGNGMTLAYTNYTVGRIVKVMATKSTGTGTDSISLGGVTATRVSSGSTSISSSADQTTFIELVSTNGTIGGVFVKL